MDVDFFAADLFYVLDGVGDDGQRPKTEEVHLQKAEFLDEIAGNIERFVPEPGKVKTVYYVTGPGALEKVLARHRIEYVPRNRAAVQGAYSNERFQYADRPGSKWKYKTVFIDRTEYRKGAPLAKKDDSKE